MPPVTRGRRLAAGGLLPLLIGSLLFGAGAGAEATACLAPLDLNVSQPWLIKDLGGGATLRVWQASDPGHDGTFPVSVVTLGGGAAVLRPTVGQIPGLLDPARPFVKRQVVATMNGDYFRYLSETSAVPDGLVSEGGRVVFSPEGWSRVVTVDATGRVRHAIARVEGFVRAAGQEWPIHSVNDPRPRTGHTLLTGAWNGSRGSWGDRTVVVRFADGRVTRVSREKKPRLAPEESAITLPADDARVLAVGAPIQISVRAVTREGKAILHASGHGGHILRDGEVRDLCSDYEGLARPRSMIAWNSSDGVWLLTAGTGDAPETSNIRAGGSTKAQLADVARKLGATHGVVMDGGGSTALYARWRSQPQRMDADQRTWVRPIPVVWTVHVPGSSG